MRIFSLSFLLAAAPAWAAQCPDFSALLRSAKHVHRKGVSYLYDTAFLRVERDVPDPKDPLNPFKPETRELLKVTEKLPGDGYFDQDDAVFVVDGSASLERNPGVATVPLRDEDKQNCVIRYLLDNGYIVAGAPRTENDAVLSDIHRVAPVSAALETRSAIAFSRIVMYDEVVALGPDSTIAAVDLQPEVAVAVYSPRSRTGVVAHVFQFGDAEKKVADVMNHFQGEDPASLTAWIIGGWSGLSEKCVYHLDEALKARHVNVSFKDVLGDGSVRSFYLDTAAGRVYRIR